MFSMIAWPECVMSTFAEHRQETFPSSPSLLLHHPPPPSQYMVHVLLITSKSRSRPRASTFSSHMVWSSRPPSLEIPLPTPTLKHPGPSRAWSVNASVPVLTHVNAACMQTQAPTRSDTRVTCMYTSHPAFIPLGPFWLTVPAPARDYEGKGEGGRGGWGPAEGWRVLRLEQQRVRKRAGGLGPVSFINLNVYTSWSLAMRPLSFPQVSPPRICGPSQYRRNPTQPHTSRDYWQYCSNAIVNSRIPALINNLFLKDGRFLQNVTRYRLKSNRFYLQQPPHSILFYKHCYLFQTHYWWFNVLNIHFNG